MPYIKKDKREALDGAINDMMHILVSLELDDPSNNMEGNINYIMTRMLKRAYPATSYKNINDAVGLMECCKLEYYREVAVPYENQKKFENGMVEG